MINNLILKKWWFLNPLPTACKSARTAYPAHKGTCSKTERKKWREIKEEEEREKRYKKRDIEREREGEPLLVAFDYATSLLKIIV